jgi:dienelactone hydrolase
MKKLFTLVVAVSLLATTALGEKKEVRFNATDGFALKGTFYPSANPGPGILLLHQCDADRQVYDHLGGMLSTAGYNVLAMDFRGFGESKAGEYANFAGQRSKIIDKVPADIETGLNFLTSQKTVNTRALGIVAGNCAVNPAVHAAARHAEIRTLVLLSGGSDAEGETYIKNSPKVPIFGAWSEEDSDAAATKKLVELSPNHDSQFETFKNAGHAASMFAKQPDLEADIVVWFRSNLPVGGYGLPPAIK